MLFLLLFSYTQALSAQDKIGSVVFARGAISAQSGGGQVRILGKDAEIYRTDTITTGPKSFAVLSLNDGTRLSIRPNSVLAIDDYVDEAGAESATMRLFKGGLRAISGLISKRSPGAFRVKTTNTTLGVYGTEFDARLCDADCADGVAPKKAKTKSSVIGRVALLKGQVTAQQDGREVRVLTRMAPLYETDEIITGKRTYVTLAFRDRGSMTLKPESRLKVEQYDFHEKEPEKDRVSYNLLNGGVRALTGLIGERSPERYKVRTAVTTIGIRGTGFDLLWLGACTNKLPECGLTAAVWEGVITSENDSGVVEIGLNRAARISAVNIAPDFIKNPPVFNVPRPDTVDVDFDNLFATQSRSGVEPGLYVACYDGHCAMLQDDRALDLGAGEAGFASLDGQELLRLEQIMPFQEGDPYLNTINEQFDTLYELLDEKVVEETEFECVVQ